MSKFIGIQSGHLNIASNCDPTLATETGAPGEMGFNWQVTLQLSEILQKYGFQVQLDDANASCPGNPGDTTTKDFDFYLAIHAESNPPGGEVAAPDPSVDASNTESKRIVAAIENVYFADTGIADVEQIDTANMNFYYMWNVLTAKTPCGIIECGSLQDAHDSVILADHRRVALGIAHGLCDAFNIEWRGDPDTIPTPPPPPDPCANVKESLSQLQAEFDSYKQSHPDVTISSPIVDSGSSPSTLSSTQNTEIAPTDQSNQVILTIKNKQILAIVLYIKRIFSL